MGIELFVIGVMSFITFLVVIILGMRQLYEIGINKGNMEFSFIMSTIIGITIIAIMTILLMIGIYDHNMKLILTAVSINIFTIIMVAVNIYNVRKQ